jgi:AcrR family transcriptional regulator
MTTTDKKIYILDVAEELFSKYGSKNTTVRLITEKADVNQAMLNYYFGSKENLFMMVINRRIEILLKTKKHLNIKDKTVFEELLIYTNFYIDLIVDHLPFYRLMMNEKLLNENEKIVTLIDFYFKSNIQTLKDILNKGMKEKEIKYVDIDAFIVIVSGLLVYLIFKTDEVLNVLDQKAAKVKEYLQGILLSFFVENDLLSKL